MAVSDSGSWRLLIYPLIIIFVIAFVMNMTIKPFIDSGVSAPNNLTIFETAMINTFNYGFPINQTFTFLVFTIDIGDIVTPIYNFVVPQTIKDFMSEQVLMFSYLPNIVKYPLLVLLLISLGYAIYVLIVMIPIPFT